MDDGISTSIDTDPAEYNINFKGKIDFKLNDQKFLTDFN